LNGQWTGERYNRNLRGGIIEQSRRSSVCRNRGGIYDTRNGATRIWSWQTFVGYWFRMSFPQSLQLDPFRWGRTQVDLGEVFAKTLATCIVHKDIQASQSGDMVIDDPPRNPSNRALRDHIPARPFPPFASFLWHLLLLRGGKRWSHRSPLVQKE
jgi:hypothetical protein